MKKLIVLFLLISNIMNAQNISKNTALIIVDIQNFYFPSGKIELVNSEEASINAKKILEYFRKNKMLVVHVQHNFEPGGEIHENVKPLESEKIFTKKEVNSFKGTGLLEYLNKNNIENLVICGMQTHMCLEAVTRAAYDYDFKCTVIEDACATRNLQYNNKTIKAEDVQNSTLATLKSYAEIKKTNNFLNQ